MNFCFVYSILWGSILILYSFGWSSLCSPLAPGLLVFFVLSIVISLVLGVIFKDFFRFNFLEEYPDRGCMITLTIVVAGFIEYLYCGQIPLASILMGTQSYTSFTGIPTFHTIYSTFASFYAQYLFYLYICFPKKKSILMEYITIITVAFFFQFNRGQILINIFISLSMFIASIRGKIKPKHVIGLILLTIIILYVFGGLGNMRHGYGWNDSRYIELLGKYNKYPSWLPKQFMWAYSYITSPMANLNYNVKLQYTKISIVGTVVSYVPDFISKRFFQSYFDLDTLLVVSYFTGTPAFGKAYLWGGYCGIVLLYCFILFGQIVLLSLFNIQDKYKMPMIGIMCAIVAFTFFTHTISYSAISFTIVYPILTYFGDSYIKITKTRLTI